MKWEGVLELLVGLGLLFTVLLVLEASARTSVSFGSSDD